MTRAEANRFLDRVKTGEVDASERTILLALCLTGDLPMPWRFDLQPKATEPTTEETMQ